VSFLAYDVTIQHDRDKESGALISVQISVYYYPHIVQNCQLSIKVHFLKCGKQELYAPLYSLVGVFEDTMYFKCPHKKKSKLDKSEDLEYHDTNPPRPIHLPGNVRSK